eukprot:357847-Chlamydomonas_euryale.AAC.6
MSDDASRWNRQKLLAETAGSQQGAGVLTHAALHVRPGQHRRSAWVPAACIAPPHTHTFRIPRQGSSRSTSTC